MNIAIYYTKYAVPLRLILWTTLRINLYVGSCEADLPFHLHGTLSQHFSWNRCARNNVCSCCYSRTIHIHDCSDLLLLRQESHEFVEAPSSAALQYRCIQASPHVLPCKIKLRGLGYIRIARHSPCPCNLARHVRGGPGSVSGGSTSQCDACPAPGSTSRWTMAWGNISIYNTYMGRYSNRTTWLGVHSSSGVIRYRTARKKLGSWKSCKRCGANTIRWRIKQTTTHCKQQTPCWYTATWTQPPSMTSTQELTWIQ